MARATAQSKEEIEAEVRRLAPFHHAIPLPHGLSTDLPGLARRPIDHTRLPELKKQVWPRLLRFCGGSLRGQRVLDVGCNCGGFSFAAASSGAEDVLGLDITERYLEQASFVKQVLGADNVEFRRLPIEELDRKTIGSFQVALCFGLLYHLEDPVLAMKKLADVTERILVLETKLEPRWPDEPVWTMELVSPVEADSRIASTGLWRQNESCQFAPTIAAVKQLLSHLGFRRVVQLDPIPDMWEPFLDGRRATFIATRSGVEAGR